MGKERNSSSALSFNTNLPGFTLHIISAPDVAFAVTPAENDLALRPYSFSKVQCKLWLLLGVLGSLKPVLDSSSHEIP